MKKIIPGLVLCIFISTSLSAQSDSIVLRDVKWDKNSPAGSTELFIPSDNALLAGLIYKPNGAGKHPTLLLLHGYPGNERNLDLAQVVRATGWNVIYFDYRGSWGSQGKFSFMNCVGDVVNVVKFCNKYQDSLQIDTSNIVLFGHSMGGWICLKALQALPQIKKGFALSTWNIYGDYTRVMNQKERTDLANNPELGAKYFVLNASLKEIFEPVARQPDYFNLAIDGKALADKQIIMLDEHHRNKEIADALKLANKTFFKYEVWDTDHPFSNKRVSLMNELIAFLNKKSFVDFDGIDSSIKPGDNFFRYVNGRWYDSAKIAADQAGVGSYSFLNIPQKQLLQHILDSVSQTQHAPGSIDQKVGDFYASGMDTATINRRGYEPIRPILAQIDAIGDVPSLMKFVAAGLKTGNQSIIGFGISPDNKNSSINIAHAFQTGIGLPDRDYYFKTDSPTLRIQQAYVKYIGTLFQLTGSDPAAASRNANLVYGIEKQLAASHKTNIELRDVDANYHKIAIAS
ncbi:MAG TPA: alpha/beta fold hydrolase, partial [Puia sp.]|nr:alpha/beta fold hydrolase [Puia sp.]